ncbi:ABC transporter permease [Dielma fastidiosa]|uniref:ABC transporter permease n=1 Tax=Dielma fastidiosa TaxID=1034346 RepID=UPI000E4AF924|nr:ABC transporter permease [Dielma fastidiosa]RHN00214.1 ABC transporter permease [Dielma fastidiosa]
MQVKQAFKMAVKSIKGNRFRSFLTMLGIIIGVASVIVLVALINGFSSDMSESFSTLGTELITVNITGRSADNQVAVDEMIEVLDSSENLAYCSPQVNISVTAKADNENVSTTAFGVNEDYTSIKGYQLNEGRLLQYGDTKNRLKVAVIGTYIADTLFSGKSPIGKSIKLNAESYEIVGVLEEKADSSEGSDDDIVLIPYSAASRLTRNSTISSYLFNASSSTSVEAGINDIQAFLNTKFTSSDYYRISSAAESLEQVNSLTSTLTLVLVGVASISLLVGGIGIMNIMLVSVSERTKEIGIRKSLGGRYRDILTQFVIEAGLTSAMGGVAGIFLGIILAYIASGLLGMTVKISLLSVAVSFSVSVGIGILFGYSPARKAARLSPIEALRYS